ncbi:protein-L-isoaspartate O-methyltransferase family protein [Microvirga mediterraneensis]|uniref:Protein-L-isoaspartate O-methyltransferase n=1 Tax=Microvirga mediterraneensis TaxID=2754695 RepID=A0A838BP95_9HYPH|nr:methyltransferase domain-containing protein [Microvirga mediterraneensis]MBA1156773.1 methyltransferase domain-containing protein [Microvirga mediterraneensis]
MNQDVPFLAEADLRDEQEAIGAASFILSLRAKGIRDTALLRAMELVPREVFAPRRFSDLARTDVALPLPCGQTMTGPATVAAMLLSLGVQPGQRILEVGTGSGYVTALLARLSAEVTSVERFNTLAESAAQHLRIVEAGKVRLEVGDGLATRVRDRFDRILLNGACPEIPETVTNLLGPGSRLVGAVTIEGVPHLVRIERNAEGELAQSVGAALRLSPLVSGIAATL